MRQTLHLVTRADYALFRAALSETNFPWESATAKKLARSVRALAAAGPVTSAEAVAYLEERHGVEPGDARRAWRAARQSGHLVHHHETALWHARPAGRFVATDIPETRDPTQARAELLRRYLAAFGPATKRDIGTWSMMHVPEITRALALLELRRFRDEQGRELLDVPRGPLPAAPARGGAAGSSTCRAARPPVQMHRRRCASCRSGTTCPSRTRPARVCCPSRTARR